MGHDETGGKILYRWWVNGGPGTFWAVVIIIFFPNVSLQRMRDVHVPLTPTRQQITLCGIPQSLDHIDVAGASPRGTASVWFPAAKAPTY